MKIFCVRVKTLKQIVNTFIKFTIKTNKSSTKRRYDIENNNNNISRNCNCLNNNEKLLRKKYLKNDVKYKNVDKTSFKFHIDT